MRGVQPAYCYSLGWHYPSSSAARLIGFPTPRCKP